MAVTGILKRFRRMTIEMQQITLGTPGKNRPSILASSMASSGRQITLGDPGANAKVMLTVGNGFLTGSVTTGTTAANISNTGLTIVGNASTTKTYTLDKPVKGALKYLSCSIVGSTAAAKQQIIASGAGVTFGSSNTKIRFKAKADCAILYGRSTAAWAIVGLSGAAAATT